MSILFRSTFIYQYNQKFLLSFGKRVLNNYFTIFFCANDFGSYGLLFLITDHLFLINQIIHIIMLAY